MEKYNISLTGDTWFKFWSEIDPQIFPPPHFFLYLSHQKSIATLSLNEPAHRWDFFGKQCSTILNVFIFMFCILQQGHNLSRLELSLHLSMFLSPWDFSGGYSSNTSTGPQLPESLWPGALQAAQSSCHLGNRHLASEAVCPQWEEIKNETAVFILYALQVFWTLLDFENQLFPLSFGSWPLCPVCDPNVSWIAYVCFCSVPLWNLWSVECS